MKLGLWIGLNDLNEQMSFTWADGSPVLATYWMHSEPNNWLGKNEDCVEAISYKEVPHFHNASNLFLYPPAVLKKNRNKQG